MIILLTILRQSVVVIKRSLERILFVVFLSRFLLWLLWHLAQTLGSSHRFVKVLLVLFLLCVGISRFSSLLSIELSLFPFTSFLGLSRDEWFWLWLWLLGDALVSDHFVQVSILSLWKLVKKILSYGASLGVIDNVHVSGSFIIDSSVMNGVNIMLRFFR